MYPSHTASRLLSTIPVHEGHLAHWPWANPSETTDVRGAPFGGKHFAEQCRRHRLLHCRSQMWHCPHGPAQCPVSGPRAAISHPPAACHTSSAWFVPPRPVPLSDGCSTVSLTPVKMGKNVAPVSISAASARQGPLRHRGRVLHVQPYGDRPAGKRSRSPQPPP